MRRGIFALALITGALGSRMAEGQNRDTIPRRIVYLSGNGVSACRNPWRPLSPPPGSVSGFGVSPTEEETHKIALGCVKWQANTSLYLLSIEAQHVIVRRISDGPKGQIYYISKEEAGSSMPIKEASHPTPNPRFSLIYGFFGNLTPTCPTSGKLKTLLASPGLRYQNVSSIGNYALRFGCEVRLGGDFQVVDLQENLALVRSFDHEGDTPAHDVWIPRSRISDENNQPPSD